MIHFFSFIPHTKVAKVVLSGELANSSPLAFAEGLFYWDFFKKEGFLKDLS